LSIIAALKLSLPTHPAHIPCMAAIQGRHIVKRSDTTVKVRINEAHTRAHTRTRTHRNAHIAQGGQLLMTQVEGQKRLLAILNRHPNFYDCGPISKDFDTRPRPTYFVSWPAREL
jgi:hypothetical protein